MNLSNAIQAARRGFMLKCPRCGVGPLYQRVFRMRHHCPSCGLVFEREQGYFVGAIYINVIATEFLLLVTLLVFYVLTNTIDERAFTILYAVAVVSPLLIYRHSRSLWLSFDHFIDPASDSYEDEKG
jgi:uncharacterized protein (DUF983 family)